MKSVVDVPVALIFFNRPDLLVHSFSAIRKAKPTVLFLIQDGPRINNNRDLQLILECRELLVIDWDCEVHYDFSDVNLGCGMRIYSGITNAFKRVDRLCIIEDDCVPNMSYFHFCKEVLDKYKDDNRIDMVSGMNNFGINTNVLDSYFFSLSGSIWGWATWRRAWDGIDYSCEFLNDKHLMSNFLKAFPYKHISKELLKVGHDKLHDLKRGLPLKSWSYQRGMNMYLNNSLSIVPKYNLVKNIGLHIDNTNGTDDIRKLPLSIQKLFNMQVYDMDGEISHPKFVIRDVDFDDRMFGSTIAILFRNLEGYVRRIILGDFTSLYKGLLRRIRHIYMNSH